MATVMLDAGHGGFDNGAVFGSRKEKEDTLNLVLAIGNMLENAGVDVLYTRTVDEYQSPSQKAQIANESDADYFISIHRNSGAEPDLYAGVQTLVYEDSGIPAVFAQNINSELAKVGFNNIGVEERKNLAVLRRTRMPSALVEVGFINTAEDNEIFDKRFPEIARAVTQGILKTVQGADVRSQSVESYSIEIGSFRHYENAQELAQSLQERGFDCFIVSDNGYHSVYHGRFDDFKSAETAEKILFAHGYETRVVPNVRQR